MAMIDPEQERLRLAGFYSHQTDGELEQVAQQAEELTEVAREALRAELIRRGVPVESLDRAGDADHSLPEFRDLVTIRSFWGLLEADLAKGLLDAAGIECFLFDGNMVRMDWFNANALGGVKLRVDADNVEAANRVLDEWVSDDPVSDEPGLDS